MPVGSTSLAITARRGTLASGSQVSGFQIPERRNAFAQWKKMSSISTTTASSGRCPLTTISSKNGASLTSRARPLIRRVSPRPGIRKFSPTCGLTRMFW